MKQEKSVSQTVTEVIDSLPLMSDYLQSDIINYKGLARWIKPEVERRLGKQTTIESISVAVQRYHFTENTDEKKTLSDAISHTKLVMKNDIATVAFIKNYDLIKKINAFSDRLNWEHGDTFFTVHSSQELAVVLEHDMLEDFMRFTRPFEPLSSVDDVTMINCKYPEYIIDVPGYLYSLQRVITLAKLNIIDIFSTFTEFIFLFKKDDALEAYGVLERLINDARGTEI